MMRRSELLLRCSAALLLALMLLLSGDVFRDANAQISRPQNLLAGTIVYDMVQDAEGNLWFGTENGLIRYDGHGLRRYSTAEGLPGNSVLYVGADAAGRVWALDFTGNTSFVRQGVLHTPADTPLLEDAASSNLVQTSVFTDADTTWIAWEQHRVMRFTPDQADNFSFLNPELVSVRHIARDRRGNIMLASVDSLYQVSPGSLYPTAAIRKSFTPGRVFNYRGVPFAPFGTAWQRMEFSADAAAESAAAPWMTAGAETIKFPQPEIRGRMFTAIETYDEFIALGTTDGLYFISPEPGLPVKTALEGMFVNRVLQDFEGNIWASTLGSGVFKFPAGFWQTAGFEASKAGLSSLRSLLILPDGSVIYGSASEVYGLHRNNELTLSLLPEYMSSRFGLQLLLMDYWGDDIVLASSNRLFSGPVRSDGTIDFEAGYFVTVGGAKQIVPVSENRIYAAATEGIIQIDRLPDGGLTHQNLYNRRFTALAYHPRSGLIAGSAQGVWQFRDNLLTPVFQVLENAQITDLKRWGQDELLISTNGFGLWQACLLSGELFRLFEDDLRLLNIRELKIDETGNWWLATSTGLFSYNPAAEQLISWDTGNIRRIDVKNGLLAYITSDVAVERSVAQANGPEFRLNLNHPRLIADQVQVALKASSLLSGADGSETRTYSAVSLPHHTRLLQLDTSAPFFREEGQLKYFFRLEPADTGWQETRQPDFTFRVLRPGSYRLHIRAEAPGAQAATALLIPFVIEAPFWKKSWFLVLTFLLSLGLLVALVQLQLRAVKRREQAKLLQYVKTVELEQQALTAMMNPHFVFNVLNSVRQFMAAKEDGKADEYLLLFARLIRLQLEATFRKKISLRQELELLEMYVRLEKLRIQNPLEFHVYLSEELQEELDEIEIPSMLIQPFLENALLHGIQPSAKPGIVSLTVALEGQNRLVVKLEDNGIGFDKNHKTKQNRHESLALKLITQRLELMQPGPKTETALLIESNPGEGTVVRFVLPV